jgi:ubiquitin C-terminal hydrolase
LEVANKLLEEMKQRELNLITKLEMQQRAISEAKQNVYNEFFKEGRIPSIEKTESFNPNISETEAKARAAWFQSLRVTNSPVTDLFVGQQATEITCLHCSNKHFTFENFYSLPIPLPVTSSTVFYVNYVRHQTKSQKHSEII